MAIVAAQVRRAIRGERERGRKTTTCVKFRSLEPRKRKQVRLAERASGSSRFSSSACELRPLAVRLCPPNYLQFYAICWLGISSCRYCNTTKLLNSDALHWREGQLSRQVSRWCNYNFSRQRTILTGHRQQQYRKPAAALVAFAAVVVYVYVVVFATLTSSVSILDCWCNRIHRSKAVHWFVDEQNAFYSLSTLERVLVNQINLELPTIRVSHSF